MGQINLHLLFLFCLSIYLLKNNRDTAAGIVLGFIFILKLLSAPILLYYLIRRQWKVVTGAAIAAMVPITLVSVLYGPKVFIDYFHYTSGFFTQNRLFFQSG